MFESFLHPIHSNPIGRNISRFAKLCPGIYWQRLDSQASRLGLDRLYVILSFDCDTREDAVAAEKLYRRFEQRHLKMTFAVPGEQLSEGADIYRALAKKGARFINHGQRPHTAWRKGRYESVNFYQEMTAQEIEDDIRRGHETVAAVTGEAPRGFRAPHFGTFQKRSQISFLHGLLAKHGYLFSTSTEPIYGVTDGIVWKDDGVYEVPHAGSYYSPLSTFDSWSYVSRTGKPVVERTYGQTICQTLERLHQRKFRGILNYYADPAHVVESEDYDRALQFLAEKSVPTLHFAEFFKLCRPPLS